MKPWPFNESIVTGAVSFVGCILLTKSLSCNVTVIIRDAVYFRIFKVFRERLFQCSKKINCRFQLWEVESYVSVRTAQSCLRTPISIKKLLNSSRLHPSGHHGNTSGCSSKFEKIPAVFADTNWEDSLHPSERHGNTIRTPRSLIRKLRAYILYPFRR
jgi:hypothetical protein